MHFYFDGYPVLALPQNPGRLIHLAVFDRQMRNEWETMNRKTGRPLAFQRPSNQSFNPLPSRMRSMHFSTRASRVFACLGCPT
jgi:hypothetical protein